MASFVLSTTWLRSTLKPFYDYVRFIFYYPKARRIVRSYVQHYHQAREVFLKEGNALTSPDKSITDIDVMTCTPASPEKCLNLPETYASYVKQVHCDAQRKLKLTENCLFFPKLAAGPLPVTTDEIPAVKRGEIIALQLRDPLSLKGLAELCQSIVPELEKKVYGSHVIVEKVYLYRNLISHLTEQVSWTWHYDNHPRQIHKVMIYLTDVDETSGPFEYVRSRITGKPLSMEPTPLAGYGRISPSWLKGRFLEGYEPHKVMGPSGTLIVFDQNIIHKANIAKLKIRDALVLQIRPCIFAPKSYVDPNFTGSFQHCDFNPDPYDYQTHLKTKMVSG